MNNLNDLNKVLFETIEGLKDGSIEVSKAQAIKGIGDTVINGAKTLLQAHKQAGTNKAPEFFELPDATAPKLAPQKSRPLFPKPVTKPSGKSPGEILAHRKGYKSVAEYRAGVGEGEYTEELRKIKQELKAANRM